MNIVWTSRALSDLSRLHDFLAPANARAAQKLVRSLHTASGKLLLTPRIGERLDQFQPREIRRVLVGQYEIRYEIKGDLIVITRLWHTRHHR